MVRQYWRQIWQTARRESWATVMRHLPATVISVLIGGAVLFVLVFYGSAGAAGDEALARGAGVLVTLLALGGIVGWNIAKAAAVQDEGQKKEIAKLTTQVETKRLTTEIAKKIGDYWFAGNDLMNQAVLTDADYFAWSEAATKWGSDVTEYLHDSGLVSESVMFATLPITNARQFPGVQHEQHNAMMNEVHQRLGKLRRIWGHAAERAQNVTR